MKKIAIGSDHAGFEYKTFIKKHLEEAKYEVLDSGTHNEDSVDYPDFVHPVVKAVVENKADAGILICGTGNGVAMTANKYEGIRAGLCWNDEISKLIRLHNDANVLCIPGRFISKEMTTKIVEAFLETEFEGGRHQRRIDKICVC